MRVHRDVLFVERRDEFLPEPREQDDGTEQQHDRRRNHGQRGWMT